MRSNVGIVRITSDGIFAHDCKIYDAEGREIIEQLMPTSVTIFLSSGQLNEVAIEIQHVRLDIQGKGIVSFKVQSPLGKTLSPEEENEYKRQFLQTIRNELSLDGEDASSRTSHQADERDHRAGGQQARGRRADG